VCVRKIVAEAQRDGRWNGRAGGRGFIQPPVVWMSYCWGPGWVLHALGVVQSPWNMSSGVRFSWMTRMMCWKEVIWAAAGAVRQSAASVKGNRWFMTLSS